MKSIKKFYYLSVFYLILGLSSGVFFREFTKFKGFTGKTVLNTLHSHVLILGFVFFIIVMILEKLFLTSTHKYNKTFLVTYNLGLILLIISMLIRGVSEVIGKEFVLAHMSGLGHAILGLGFIFFMMNLYDSIK
ncbi:DUF2871 family protein [Oceanirhabdus sp. W0125-5]|uniref:DUF2871 family protein n=1 Tax=Oceanirhabdus sp. W0125-5 TaxID=2999116 RepID=UPI0022F30421|nr:DUF2871 family protein [Oceanirhabdus sp. W0125-5]WBW97855.1 DUF2871 family protein [Oceanirhabdus sp. W0125-5]